MIWYLLYPFRGTTEPPTLSPSHPLRKAFTDYGREAARHPVITLLISVALSVSLIYPFPFLYTNSFTNGASNLPHHVWTSAQPYEGDLTTPIDIVMRSLWVHGSYMKALESDVLLAALDIQNELLGPTVNFNPNRTLEYTTGLDPMTSLTPDVRDSFHAIRGLSNQSWFFHSPLLYWDCSKQAIKNDTDIVATVNAHSKKTTSVNVTLRHSIVFSGKRFESNRLVAADALVITLVHKLDSPVGRYWEKQAESLASKGAGRWRIFPLDGRSWTSQLYEFRFQPLSFQDDLFLGVAYTLTTIYFLLSLKRLRALKSRIGLTITVVTHMAISIMSSFTICAVLKIDLSKIPREAYPLVVLAISLENMFRLTNTVIVTPSENSTASRIAEALGQTGHIALAGVGQNLFILWALAKVVSPGVAAFCVFAAVALTFDFLYLLTFFVAVLSVDVRRLELSDSLTRAEQRRKYWQPKPSDRHTFTDAVVRGELPVSTRIAGTVVMIGFVLVAQWHFFDNENPLRTLSRVLRLSRSMDLPGFPNTTGSSLEVNQARSPTAWLRLQDHETAHEVIKIIKPNAHSYVARVYDPLVVVLNGSNRTPSLEGIRPLLPAIYDFVKNQSTPFFMTVIFAVAFVSLLMNYLLWDQEDINDNKSDRSDSDPGLAVKTLPKGHVLDIVKLGASLDGVVVSVGLDRWIRVWDVRNPSRSHVVASSNNGIDPFPVLAITIDDSSQWLAILSPAGRIMLWDISERRWGPSVEVEGKGRVPVAFFFQKHKINGIPPLVLVRTGGILSEIQPSSSGSPKIEDLQVCKSPLVNARPFWDKGTSGNEAAILRVVTTSRRGCVHIASQLPGGWVSDGIDDIFASQQDQHVISIVPLPKVRALLTMREKSIDLIHIETLKVAHSFGDLNFKPTSIKCFHTIKRKPNCGSVGIASFSLVYNDRDSDDVVMRTFTPKIEGDLICIGARKCADVTCSAWSEVNEQEYRMKSPGNWDVLPEGVAIGTRKRQSRRSSSRDSAPSDTVSNPSLRRRGSPTVRSSPVMKPEEDDSWEVWMLSAKGDKAVVPLYENGLSQTLLVSSCGPMTKVGQQSMAVGFGNVIKVVSVGNERFESIDDSSEDTRLAMAGRRRKAQGIGKRNYLQ